MSKYRYILEKYKGMNTRYRCPKCNHKEKTFVRYIDTLTGEHIHPEVGRCNREINCGYHYTPKQYFQDNKCFFDEPKKYQHNYPLKENTKTNEAKAISYIPTDIFRASLKAYDKNNFVQYLINLFGFEITNKLISDYFIGTSKKWNGATVFWQIDLHGKIRTGKIMHYNPHTGKRTKEPFNHIYWVHKAINLPDFELKQCLFGEHLLSDKTKPVAIVESEKTAIIASVYMPQFIWVAVGSLNNLNVNMCNALKGRTVTLFPDLNGYEKWNNKAKELSHYANFIVSELLEKKAIEEEKKQGYDIADYLVRYDFNTFFLPEHCETFPETISIPKKSVDHYQNRIYENSEQKINELELFF